MRTKTFIATLCVVFSYTWSVQSLVIPGYEHSANDTAAIQTNLTIPGLGQRSFERRVQDGIQALSRAGIPVDDLSFFELEGNAIQPGRDDFTKASQISQIKVLLCNTTHVFSIRTELENPQRWEEPWSVRWQPSRDHFHQPWPRSRALMSMAEALNRANAGVIKGPFRTVKLTMPGWKPPANSPRPLERATEPWYTFTAELDRSRSFRYYVGATSGEVEFGMIEQHF